eukprot:gene1625-2267_t
MSRSEITDDTLCVKWWICLRTRLYSCWDAVCDEDERVIVDRSRDVLRVFMLDARIKHPYVLEPLSSWCDALTDGVMRGARSRYPEQESQMALDEIDTCADPIMKVCELFRCLRHKHEETCERGQELDAALFYEFAHIVRFTAAMCKRANRRLCHAPCSDPIVYGSACRMSSDFCWALKLDDSLRFNGKLQWRRHGSEIRIRLVHDRDACSHCTRPATFDQRMRHCGNCYTVAYCSRACQMNAWAVGRPRRKGEGRLCREVEVRPRRKGEGRLCREVEGEINDRSIYTTRQSGTDIFDDLRFRFDHTEPPGDGFFEDWPNTAENLGALCREAGNRFENKQEAEDFANWRFCVVDGGYVGLIVSLKTNQRGGEEESWLELDFGFYMEHRKIGHIKHRERIVKPLKVDNDNPLPYNRANSRLLKADFNVLWTQKHPSRGNAFDWVRDTCVGEFSTSSASYYIVRPCARLSAYNALRHLDARNIRNGLRIPQSQDFVVAQRKIVSFLLLHNLLQARRRYNLHDQSKYQPWDANDDPPDLSRLTRTWFHHEPNGVVARTEMSANEVVKRMHLAIVAARESIHPEIRGILTRAQADETLDDLSMLDASAACLPPKLTFGFTRVRVGTQKVNEIRNDMLRSGQFEIFGARLRDDTIAQQSQYAAVGAVVPNENRRIRYNMDIVKITEDPEQNGLTRNLFYTNTLPREVNSPINTDYSNVQSTADVLGFNNVFAQNRVPTGRYVDSLCLPMEADQFGLQLEADRRCRYNFAQNYLQDAFPIPERMPSVQVAPRTRETQDYETRMEDTLETLCHVFAANTHAALKAFMQQRGYLIFSDKVPVASTDAMSQIHGELVWDVIGAEYPIYNPHAMFTKTEAQKPYPLFYETRADAVLHARYPNSTDTVLNTGRVIMVEYKDVMEVNSPARRIMEYRSIYQCLGNAYLFFIDVGVLPTHALMVHSTRRAVYKDREYRPSKHSAYVSLLRVNISSRMQMRLFQRILTNPLNFRTRGQYNRGLNQAFHEGETVYMDDRVFLIDANSVRINPNWYPSIGEPNEDMPAVMAQDDPGSPNFAITRACVALHEKNRLMWHGNGAQVDTDARVRPQQYPAARDNSTMSRFMAYDSVVRHVPPNQTRNLCGPNNNAVYSSGVSMGNIAALSAQIELNPRESLWRKLGDWHNVAHPNPGPPLIKPLEYVLIYRNQTQGYALNYHSMQHPETQIADDRFLSLCDNIQAPPMPTPEMDDHGALLRVQPPANTSRRKLMAPAAIIFDISRQPMMAHYDRGLDEANNAQPPGNLRRLCMMPGRHYRDEPALNANIRGRVNNLIMRRARELHNEFPNGDVAYHFNEILRMRNTADLNRAQFGNAEYELYNNIPVADDEVDEDDPRQNRTPRVVLFYRVIQRLVNVRIFEAAHALVGAPLGFGWFNEDYDLDDPIRRYKRSQVFPHVSDRGSWSTFMLKVLAADVPQDVEGDNSGDNGGNVAPNVIVLVCKLINAILNRSPNGESANWAELVNNTESILRDVASEDIREFSDVVFKVWLRSLLDSDEALDHLLRLSDNGPRIPQQENFDNFLEVYVHRDTFIDGYLKTHLGRKVFRVIGDGTCLLHAYAYSHILSSQARTNARAGFAGYQAPRETIDDLRTRLMAKMSELNMPLVSREYVRTHAHLDEYAIQALAVLYDRDVYLQAYTDDGRIHESLGLRGFPRQGVVPLDEPDGLVDRAGVWLPPFRGRNLTPIRVAMSQSMDLVGAPIVLVARAILTGGTSSNHFDATTNVPDCMTYQAALRIPFMSLQDIIQKFNRTPLRLLTKENALFVLEHDTRLRRYAEQGIQNPSEIIRQLNDWLRGVDDPGREQPQNRLNEENLNKGNDFSAVREAVLTNRKESNRMRVNTYLQGDDDDGDQASFYSDDHIHMYYQMLQGRDQNKNFIFLESQGVQDNNSHFYNTEEDPARATNGPSVLTLHPDDCKNLDAYRGNVRSFILPHMLNNAHWFLVVLHLPDAADTHGRVLIYDPSPGEKLLPQQVRNLKSLMVHATKVLNLGLNRNVNTELINFWYVRGHPVQENDYDCGVYTCIYTNYVTRGQAVVDPSTVRTDRRNRKVTVQLMADDPLHELCQIYLPFIRKRIHYECLTCELSDELPPVDRD